MVIPGVSGSMVLMLMGFYQPILDAIKSFFTSLAAMDMDGILTGLGILVPFGIGIVIGVFAIAKLVEIIFKKPPDSARRQAYPPHPAPALIRRIFLSSRQAFPPLASAL